MVGDAPSIGKKQATRRELSLGPTCARGGSAIAHSGLALKHRVRKRHPLGGLTADGGSPARMIRFLTSSISGSGTGMADISEAVYGCSGSRYRLSAGATSFILP